MLRSREFKAVGCCIKIYIWAGEKKEPLVVPAGCASGGEDDFQAIRQESLEGFLTKLLSLPALTSGVAGVCAVTRHACAPDLGFSSYVQSGLLHPGGVHSAFAVFAATIYDVITIISLQIFSTFSTHLDLFRKYHLMHGLNEDAFANEERGCKGVRKWISMLYLFLRLF